MKKKEALCQKNKHKYYCDCLQCLSRRAFCTCSECILRRTRFSGKFTDGRDLSKNPSLQQLVDLAEGEKNHDDR